jgi:hypothetical protein
MNEDILIVDIDALINAYNEGLTQNISTNFTNTNVDIGVAQPLTSMEAIIESSLVASDLSFAKYSIDLVTETNSLISEEASTAEEAIEIKDYLYSECYTTDIEGNRTENLDFLTGDTFKQYSWEEGIAVKKKRYSNDLNANLSFNLTRYLDDKYIGKDGTVGFKYGKNKDGTDKVVDLNFGLEQCFDCVIDINLNLLVPALEFTFDFSKQLRQLKRLLEQLENDLNPTLIFKMLCDTFLNFGKNLICPSNLVAIQLLLPTLFTKYSLDLVKLRFDWTCILGPIMKTAIGAITSYVENVPKLIVPFIDCIINALRATVRYISNIIQSVENVYETLSGAINQAASAIVSSLQTSKEIFEGLGIIDSDIEDIEEDIETLSEEIAGSINRIISLEDKEKQIDNKVNQLKKAVDAFVTYLVTKYNALKVKLASLKFEEIKYDLIEFLTEFPQYINIILGSYSRDDLLILKDLEKEKKKLESLSNERGVLNDEYNKESLESKSRKKYFRVDFVADNRPLGYLSSEGRQELEDKIYNEKVKNYLDTYGPTNSLEAKKKEFRAEAKKIAFTQMPGTPKKTKDKKDLAWGLNSKNQDYKRPDSEKWNWHDILFAKYGIDIENKYQKNNYNLLPKANFAKSSSKSIKDFVDTYMIKYLLETKDYILKVTGNVILAFKSLEMFLGEYVETDLKIMGNIQEILHLIRFSRLIYELLSNGFSSCKDIKENKPVFESILQQTNQELLLDDSILEKQNLDPQDYIALKSKDGRYSNIIDLNNCEEAFSHFSVSENNLDQIYEGILNGIYR